MGLKRLGTGSVFRVYGQKGSLNGFLGSSLRPLLATVKGLEEGFRVDPCPFLLGMPASAQDSGVPKPKLYEVTSGPSFNQGLGLDVGLRGSRGIKMHPTSCDNLSVERPWEV